MCFNADRVTSELGDDDLETHPMLPSVLFRNQRLVIYVVNDFECTVQIRVIATT